jgi:16S rRNA (adenine1518-N6/adenine1519-N6)-dimethyltransferase
MTRLGQHFLRDPNLARLAADRANVSVDDVVLEVGPGRGILTRVLAERAARVVAIELDERLEGDLDPLLAAQPNLEIIWADAMDVDLAGLEPAPTAFVANLPYSVATPLILRSLTETPTIDRWCVMVQREIADRLFAEPSTPAYGAVTVLVRLAAVRTDLHPVGRQVFDPPPRVDSALVAFRRRPEWADLASRWSTLSRLIHAGFAHRRKTLANGLALAGIASRAATETAVDSLGFDPRVRAEAIAPDRWPDLLDVLETTGREAA